MSLTFLLLAGPVVPAAHWGVGFGLKLIIIVNDSNKPWLHI